MRVYVGIARMDGVGRRIIFELLRVLEKITIGRGAVGGDGRWWQLSA